MNAESDPVKAPAMAEATAPTDAVETKVSACDELHGRILTDINDMMDFIRAEGKPLPDDLRAKVAKLCYGEPEGSKPDGAEPAAEKSPSVAGNKAFELSLAMEVHGKLSQIVAPANPRTIRASRLTGKSKFLADNTTVKLLLGISIVSLIVFLTIAGWQATINVQAGIQAQLATNIVGTAAVTMQSTNEPPQKKSPALTGSSFSVTATWHKAIMDILVLFAAASLGSAFYGLYTAHKYIVNCTFDPKYHQVYLIRYVLGLTSGTILGFFGRDLNLDASTKQLSAAVLALVGGYAAEAVSQILQRFAETLVTVVRGSNDDVLQAKEGELQAKAKQQETQTKNELVKGLLRVKEIEINTRGPNSDTAKEIQKQIDSLSK